MNKKQIYHLLSLILSLNVKADRIATVITNLPKEKSDWEKWVRVGSDNLVLQSLYVTLRDNRLLSYLPIDLSQYLSQIHGMNVERNTSIINQAKYVQALLDGSGIRCVFMKGVGNILDGLYHDMGERMLYDMDILIDGERMLEAAQVLMDSGFKTHKVFNPLAYPSTMHFPVLIREDFMAGVELHRLPVQYHYIKSFSRERVFETQKESSAQLGLWVMSDTNKIIHNFIHSQLMHNAHYHADVSLRNLYDMLLLSQREDAIKALGHFKHFERKSMAYLKLMYRVFDLPLPEKLIQSRSLLIKRHDRILSMSHRQLVFHHFIINSLIKYIVLPFRTLFDKNARNYVFSRLGNRHWYSEHFNAYKRKFGKRREGRKL